jgi:hypothetical protein
MIYKNITKSYNVLEKQKLTSKKDKNLNRLATFLCWIFVSLIGFALCLLGSALDKI